MHRRKEIKAAARTLAIQALQRIRPNDSADEIASRVYVQRALPTEHEDYPAILIYAHPEAVEEFDSVRFKCELDLHFEVIAAGSEAAVDSLLDDITGAIEDIVGDDETLAGTATRCLPESTDYEYAPQGRQLVGAARLTCSTHYFTCRREDTDSVPFAGLTISRGDEPIAEIDLPQE